MRVIDDFQIAGIGIQDVTAYTNATTGYTDIPGGVVKPLHRDADPTRQDSLTYLKVTYQATLSKATGGSGTVGLYANGAVVVDTEEVVTQAGGARQVSNVVYLPLASNAAQTIRLQAKSSDANVLTVTKARVTVELVRIPGGLGEPVIIPQQ